MDLSERIGRLADVFAGTAQRGEAMPAHKCRAVARVLEGYMRQVECMEVATLAPHARAGLSVVREACDG